MAVAREARAGGHRLALRDLDLAECRITGTGLAALRSLAALERLNLRNTPLDDAAIDEVVRLKKLKYPTCSAPTSPRLRSPRSRLCRSWSTWMCRAHTSSEALEAFRQQCPWVRVTCAYVLIDGRHRFHRASKMAIVATESQFQYNAVSMPEPDDKPTPPNAASSPAPRPSEPAQASPLLRSEELFRGSREILIVHCQDVYRLRLTRNGKLILTK